MRKKYTIIQGICAILLLPAINLIASAKANFFYENYSYVGNALEHPYIIYLWATLCGLYFYFSTRKAMKHTLYTNKIGRFLLLISCLGMPLSVYLPYNPELYPIISQLHIYLSIAATVIYTLVFYHFLYDLLYKNYTLFQVYNAWFSCIVIICLIMFMFYGCVNSFMEALFSTAVPILLLSLCNRLNQQ